MFKKQWPKSKSPNNQDNSKTKGLFDHINHIQYVQDPNYYEDLSDSEKKTFKLFLILRGLSMNPSFVEYAAYLYKYLDIIPPEQFYKVIISLYPKHGYKEFYRWIKSKKDDGNESQNKKTVLDLITKKYEVSEHQAKEYLNIFNSTKEGKDKLFELIMGFGFSEKEVENMIS